MPVLPDSTDSAGGVGVGEGDVVVGVGLVDSTGLIDFGSLLPEQAVSARGAISRAASAPRIVKFVTSQNSSRAMVGIVDEGSWRSVVDLEGRRPGRVSGESQ